MVLFTDMMRITGITPSPMSSPALQEDLLRVVPPRDGNKGDLQAIIVTGIVFNCRLVRPRKCLHSRPVGEAQMGTAISRMRLDVVR